MRYQTSAPPECKVYTPEPLARAMVGLLPDCPGATWLEPCVGRGVFLHALARAGVEAHRITAVELDDHAGLDGLCGEYLPGTDFLEWALRAGRRFDRVIGNPPYLPLHKVPSNVRAAALRVPRPAGGTVPPKANSWYAFLCACLELLRPRGGLCFVLPSAWEYADYAADLREAVTERFARVAVYRSEKSVFRGVLDGCVVLVADGYGGPPGAPVRRTVRAGNELIALLGRATAGLSVDAVAPPIRPRGAPPAAVIRFGEVARVRIGGVTGDSFYFLMSEAERVALGLPRSSIRPVVTRARHLTQAVVGNADWRALRETGERVWLFWPSDEVGRHPAVADYLKIGAARGVPEREKVKVRDPWYRTRLPPRPDGVMSGMTPFGPWVCLNQAPWLSATNTLYTVHFHHRLAHARRASWALSLLCSYTAGQHAALGRRYSDGLLKFEPRDVMNLSVPIPSRPTADAEVAYRKAVQALLDGDPSRARAIADAHVLADTR
jgi:adenine-specific DNA-methyltransferase